MILRGAFNCDKAIKLSLFSLVTFFVILRFRKDFVAQKTNHFSSNFINRLCGPLNPLALDLGKFIKEKYILEPTHSPYNLTNEDFAAITLPSWYILNKFSHFFFDKEEPGFFVEAGALDGVRDSNSLYLETKKNWKGLLVEPNRASFKRLKSKNRKAWISNICFSTQPFPHKASLHTQHVATSDKKSDIMNNFVYAAGGALSESPDANIYSLGFDSYLNVQCIPVQTLLMALNITRVHLFSLDIEGIEPHVLDNFPFDKIFVDIWYVEHRFRNTTDGNDFKIMNRPDVEFMQKQVNRGLIPYSVFTPHVDYVFVNKNSPFHHKYKDFWPQKWKYELTALEKKLQF